MIGVWQKAIIKKSVFFLFNKNADSYFKPKSNRLSLQYGTLNMSGYFKTINLDSVNEISHEALKLLAWEWIDENGIQTVFMYLKNHLTVFDKTEHFVYATISLMWNEYVVVH